MEATSYNVAGLFYGEVVDDKNFDVTAIDMTNYKELAHIKGDTLKDVSDENSIVDFKNAEDDGVYFSVLSEKGTLKYEFETMEYNARNLILALGGSFENGVWKAPTEGYSGVEKSLILRTRAVNGIYQVLFFPRVNLTAMLIGAFNAADSNTIKFSWTVLEPKDAATNVYFSNRYIFHKSIPPTEGSYNSTSGELTFSVLSSFPNATEYQYSTDSGTTWTTLATNPETIATGQSEVLLRTAGYMSSDLSEAQWVASESFSLTII